MPPRDPEAIWARAAANGYTPGAHETEDSCKDVNKHVEDVKRNHNNILDLYVTWWWGKTGKEHSSDHTWASVKDRILCKDATAPRMVDVKDFLRFYTYEGKGHINEAPSVDSTLSMAEFFFAGFTRVTGTPTAEDERKEVFKWVKQVLPEEGRIVNERKPKHNFSKEDLDDMLLTLWTRKDLISISERERVEFTYILHTYCWTGARLAAFFKGSGLTYKDIQLFQRRSASGAGNEFMWKIDQRWVKGNRDPNHVVFGAAGKEHSRLLYNDGALLLPMAFADKSLFGFDSLDDLWQQDIPPGDDELNLRWNDSVLDMRIVRMSKYKFLRIFRSVLDRMGSTAPASLHMIRRFLGKRVDRRHTEVERSQHILQSDPRVFGQSYVANCSSVDGQAAFLDEEADHTVSDFFQGLRVFRERGAPTELPAAKEDELEKHPEVLALKAKEAAARDNRERDEVSKALRSLKTRLKHKAFVSFREAWIRERRDWKILTRGKVSPEVDVDCNQLSLILPERKRIEEKMASTSPLSMAKMREAIQDIFTLIVRDYTVFYRPGEEPLEGLCPVCDEDVKRLDKRCRSNHIHNCRKRERAARLDQKPSSLKYCYDCTEWYVQGPEWEEHCQKHLLQLTSKSCASIQYCNTLIKPAYCPSCLGSDMPPSLRMQSWNRDTDVLAHMAAAHNTESCLHPLCQGVKFEDRQLFYNHQKDAHSFPRTSGASRKRKREDMKKQQGEKGPCNDSQHHPLHSPEKPEGGEEATACSLIANRSEGPVNRDDFDLPKTHESLDDFISQCIAFSPAPSPSIKGDEDLPSHAKTEYKTITDANADQTKSSVVETNTHADRPRVRIKLNYKRPKIVLRMGGR